MLTIMLISPKSEATMHEKITATHAVDRFVYIIYWYGLTRIYKAKKSILIVQDKFKKEWDYAS